MSGLETGTGERGDGVDAYMDPVGFGQQPDDVPEGPQEVPDQPQGPEGQPRLWTSPLPPSATTPRRSAGPTSRKQVGCGSLRHRNVGKGGRDPELVGPRTTGVVEAPGSGASSSCRERWWLLLRKDGTDCVGPWSGRPAGGRTGPGSSLELGVWDPPMGESDRERSKSKESPPVSSSLTDRVYTGTG